jgi:malate dehydrogenase (oxaloacetate-decarboxylating)
MARKCKRPIILPLSNPTSRSEAVPADLVRWTDGRALIATGSPFADVAYQGRKVRVSQCNNVFIFPAMGLAVSAIRARRVTDGMFLAAARALAEQSPALEDPAAPLLPALAGLRRAAVEIAFAVGEQAEREGLCVKSSPENLRDAIISSQWAPVYTSYL